MNLLIICNLFRGVIIYTWKKGFSLRIGILKHLPFSIGCEHIFTRKSNMAMDVWHAKNERHNEGSPTTIEKENQN
jgi:hypothetical protein